MSKTFKSPSIHRTPEYRANAAYANMKRRARNACGTEPSYADVELRMTKEQWLDWALPLYEEFDRKHPGKSPNISRKNDSGHYEIGNIELLTAEENRSQKAAPMMARPDGTKPCRNCRKTLGTSAFNKHRGRPDGLTYYCKSCSRQLQKEWRNRRKLRERQ